MSAPKEAPIQRGDRIRLRQDRIFEYQQACDAAGWAVDMRLNPVRIVIRVDPYGVGGRKRVWFNGPPHCFFESECELAWNNEDQRRQALGLPFFGEPA